MSAERSGSADGPFAAEGPHCGVCEHAFFQADWERTPYCVEHETTTSIEVNDVCSAFRPKESVPIAPEAIEEGVAIEWSEQTIGEKAPFYAAYRDEERYAWLCGNCRTLDVAADTMGRLECSDCGNTHSPTEWDAAYL